MLNNYFEYRRGAITMNGKIKGFTLIEILVVMVIIVILVSIISTGAGKVRHQSRKLQCIANLKSLHCMTSLYWQEHNYLPLKWSDLDLYVNSVKTCPNFTNDKDSLFRNYYASLITYFNLWRSKEFYKTSGLGSLLYFDPKSHAHGNYSNGILHNGKHVQLALNDYNTADVSDYNISFGVPAGNANDKLDIPNGINIIGAFLFGLSEVFGYKKDNPEYILFRLLNNTTS
ncbi:hypothetical protein BVX93_01210 [bacterium B13(2017)]|nr:hypothetical protein BVX93_01210 [bacterium B13(2017)]